MTKKILFIINSLHNKSGTERVAIGLANKLIEKYANLSVAIANRDTDISHVAYPINNDIEILQLTGNIFSFIKKLQKIITTNSYNYIIVHNMGRLSLLCSLLKVPKNSKLISLEHVSYKSRSFYKRFFSNLLYKKYDQIITLTKYDALSFKELNPNTITITNFSPFPVTTSLHTYINKKIIAVGRLTDQKNFSHLLSAWKIAKTQLSDWQLSIYGNGELEEDLKKQIVDYHIKDITINKAIKDIESVYKNADFIVMSSKYEGLGMVLIEAQSFGLPIVSYDCPHGPKEIIEHGMNGFLVKNQNIEELAKYIVKLASSESLLKKMSDNSLKVAEKYQPKAILEQWNNEVFKKQS